MYKKVLVVLCDRQHYFVHNTCVNPVTKGSLTSYTERHSSCICCNSTTYTCVVSKVYGNLLVII